MSIKNLFFEEYWAVAYRTLTEGERSALPDDTSVKRYRVLRLPRGYWAADPFLFLWDGRMHLFFEYMKKHDRTAVIAACPFPPDGTRPVAVLSPGCHTSYPAVFSKGGQVYMIPETRALGTVELYRAEAYPFRWAHAATLCRDFPAVDSTPDGAEGAALLLYAPDDAKGGAMLYRAPLDPAAGTLGAPVLSAAYDEKRGRPAGYALSIGGERIRPAQDCRARYGGSIEFLACSEEGGTYRERVAGTLTPASIRLDVPWKLLGVHTVNRQGGYEVIDVFYRRFAPLHPVFALLARLKKALRR